VDPAELAIASLFGLCLTSGIVVPLPEDVAILSAGWAVREGRMDLGSAFLGAFAGTLARDVIAFLVGRIAGDRLWALAGWLVGVDRLGRARARFEAAAHRSVFLTRFAVGMRAPLYFVAGTLRFPFRRFLLLDVLGLLVTTPLLLWIGGKSGPTASAWLVAVLPHQRLVLGGLAAVLVVAWAWRRRRAPSAPA
jgi:membrane protein DedA with SNARE-associated domain